MLTRQRWSDIARGTVSLWRAMPPTLAILGLALGVRVGYNLTAAAPYRPSFDAALYEHIALNLINHRCYCLFGDHPTVSRAPLWPWIISVIYTVAGQHNIAARLFYCVLGAGTCLIVFRFARDLFGKRAGTLAGLIAATYTGLFLYDGWLYAEPLYTFCVTGVAYALYRLQSASPVGDGGWAHEALATRGRIWHAVARHRWAVLCGLLIGAASLTRPNGVGLLGVVSLWAAILIWARLRPWRDVLRTSVVVCAIAVAVIAPWTARNYAVAGAFIPVEPGLGEVLVGSYNDIVAFGPLYQRGIWRLPPGALNHDNLRYTLATDRLYTAQALNWMAAHPAATVYLWGLHLAIMWMPYNYAHGLAIEQVPNRLSAQVVWVLTYLESIPVFIVAAAGLRTTWRRWKQALVPVYLILAMTVLQNMVLYSTIRFRAPIEPLLVILVSGAIATGLPRLAAPGGRLARWRARCSAMREPLAAGDRTSSV
ncbi:MAG: hypothetical protein PVSMB4_06560 [Ktedonobacterales bacterium]